MPRRLNLEITESLEELRTRLGEQKTAFGKERVQALYLLKLGQVSTVGELAKWLGRHRVTVQDWLAQYRHGGMSELLRYKPSTGRPCSIPPWAVGALKKRLQEPKGFQSYGAVQQWLNETLGINASYQAVYELVRRKLKAKLKVGKRQNPGQDPERVKQFKLELANNLMLLQDVCQQQFSMGEGQWRYWCQDETRWSLTTIYRRLITAFGVKPVGLMQWVCEGFWLYGVVDPQTGEHFFWEFSHLDSACFQRFLDQFSQQYANEYHIVQLDRASAHIAKGVHPPKNVVLLFQPSHAPELNPIQRLWEHLKDSLSWQLFEDLDELRHLVRERLENLTQTVVQSLTGWEYIRHALSVAGIS
jgi:transposase